jgi:hypothetical protein
MIAILDENKVDTLSVRRSMPVMSCEIIFTALMWDFECLPCIVWMARDMNSQEKNGHWASIFGKVLG